MWQDFIEVKSSMPNTTSAFNMLKRKAGVETLVFMTDHTRAPNPQEICRALPIGSIVILRDYDYVDRKVLAISLRKICRQQRIYFLVAGDFALASSIKADGVHLPEYVLFDYRAARQLKKFSLITAACHTRKSLHRATAIGVDAALVSPVFKTNSHLGAKGMGIHSYSRLIERCELAIITLGGISIRNAGKLKGLNSDGIAAIDGIARQVSG
jgi:thiamine monophosphate synthase